MTPWKSRNPFRDPAGSYEDARNPGEVSSDPYGEGFAEEKLLMWDRRWLSLAAFYGHWSKDPSRKIGAVAVIENRPLTQGWNGFPRGVPDEDRLYAFREEKYKLIVHAEANCIYNATREGIRLRGSTMYVDGLVCCGQCSLAIAQAGIARVVMAPPPPDRVEDRWKDEFVVTRKVFGLAGVDYAVYEKTPYGPVDHWYEPRAASWYDKET